MGRPATTPIVIVRIKSLRARGLTLEEIDDEMNPTESRRVVSRNTIAKYMKQWSGLDSPFQWHRLEEYGLPWEASQFLLYAYRESTLSQFTEPFHEVPTVREMQWYWRIYQAERKLPKELPFIGGQGEDIHHLALQFVFREICHELLGEPLYMDDLNALVAYRPWESEEHRRTYEQAKENGFIPSLSGNGGEKTRRIKEAKA